MKQGHSKAIYFRTSVIGLLSVVILTFQGLSAEPREPFRFVALGDSGSDSEEQCAVAERMWERLQKRPFTDVLMLGDNIYGRWHGGKGGDKKHFPKRFDAFYARFQSGVRFHAVLGNHDLETRNGQDEIADKQRFGIEGPRGYYRFSAPAEYAVDGRPLVDFFALNSTLGADDREQTLWLEQELMKSKAVWKIAFFHHPLYTPRGKHHPCVLLRAAWEPLFEKYGVQIVLTGHNHFYARMSPLKGIVHFVSGGGGRGLKEPKPRPDDCTEKAFKRAHFLYFEVHPDRVDFEAVPAGSGTPPIDVGTIDGSFLQGGATCAPWSSGKC